MYTNFFKRIIDFTLALVALVVLSPVLMVMMITGAIAMGGNPFFIQLRPGKKGKDGREKIFKLIKFRTMDNRKDENGNLLPDEVRLNAYGRFLRSTSLDELPELVNILLGEMSIVGPRPQLVRDMVFMTCEQRERHTVRAGLTGLAQVNGRNNMSWEQKIAWDLQYIDNLSFILDIKIILLTIKKVFVREGISSEGMETAEDLGDYLLRIGKITIDEYENGQIRAKELMKGG